MSLDSPITHERVTTMIFAIFRRFLIFLLIAASSIALAEDLVETQSVVIQPVVSRQIGADTTHEKPTLPAAPEIHSADHGPWLTIITGFLIATGIFLYVDPKMF